MAFVFLKQWFWGAQLSVGVVIESCSMLTFCSVLIPACGTVRCSRLLLGHCHQHTVATKQETQYVPVSKGLEQEEQKTDRQISYKMSRIFFFFPFLVLICVCVTVGYVHSLSGSPLSVWNLADEAETIDISMHALIGTFQESEVCHASG